MPAGFNIYKDKKDYKALLPEIMRVQYNIDMLFNRATINGNIGVWYDTVPPTITSTNTTTDGCTGARNVDCLNAFQRELPIDKRIDNVWKAFECALAKMDSTAMDKYAIKVEKAINNLKITEHLATLQGLLPEFIPTKTDVVEQIEELITNVETQGYDRRDLIILIDSNTAMELNIRGINCCEVNTTSTTISNKFNANIIAIKDSSVFPSGVSAMAYVRDYAVYGINCHRAEMYQASEIQYKGWVVYDHFEEYGFTYFPNDTDEYIGGYIASV